MAQNDERGERLQFASDNHAGMCPEALAALAEANEGFTPAYGEDNWTRRAADKIRDIFECDCEVFFVFNGTAANSLALASLCRSYHSVICHELAHLETDECGGPEFFSNGTKILTVSGEHGRVSIPLVEKTVTRRSDIHYPKPKVLSVTQPTELGTVYSIADLQAIGELARKYSLRLHMDGARFAQAVVSLNVKPRELTRDIGLDVLCFGGTKNGMAVGEAVVFFDRELADEFDYRCKQSGQLASKMRFLAAPWALMLETGAWLAHAAHAHRMALYLRDELKRFDAVRVMHPVQSNAVFVDMPEISARELRARGWLFHNFIGPGHYRFMCSWNATEEAVDSLIRDLASAI